MFEGKKRIPPNTESAPVAPPIQSQVSQVPVVTLAGASLALSHDRGHLGLDDDLFVA